MKNKILNLFFGKRLNLFDVFSMATVTSLYTSDQIPGWAAIILAILSIVISVSLERRAPYNQ